MTRLLEKVTNVAVLVVCCIAGFTMLHDRVSSNSPPQGLQMGQKLSVPGADFSRARQTVVVALSSHCHFCKEGVPLYQKISAFHRLNPGSFQLIVVSGDGPANITGFLQQSGVSADRVLPVAPLSIGVRGTPTVLLVDNEGRLRSSFVGLLDEGRQKELLGLLGVRGA